jgi:hypothetical protein
MITLDFDLNKKRDSVFGEIAVTHPLMGTIAGISCKGTRWEVYPYVFPLYEEYGAFQNGKGFATYEAAKAFCLAIAHDMYATRKGTWATGGKNL